MIPTTTGAAQVLVRQVEQLLIVRVGMDRRHPSLLDPEALVQHLRHRPEAVGRARRVRDDLVLRRVVLALVHAHEQRDVRLLGRRGDDDLLRPRRDVLRRGVAIGEEAGGFEHHLDAEVLPRQLRGILEREHLELVPVDGDAVAGGFHLGLQVAKHRVVLEQVSEGGGVRQVVHRDEVDVPVAHGGAHDVAADATEPVDPDLHRHRSSSTHERRIRKTSILLTRLEQGQLPGYTARIVRPTS
jgi:hypothetical protein